jgi:hypothetical protein
MKWKVNALNKFRNSFFLLSLVIYLVAQWSAISYAITPAGNRDGNMPIPVEAMPVDVSNPDQIVGTGTPESCTSEAFIAAVAKGGKIVFNGGTKPFTITLDRPAKVFNNADPDVVIDGGGLVTLSGGGKTRILYMNTADPNQVWTTSHAQNQDHPRLTVQNLTFADGNSQSESQYDGGGAIWVRGGRFKVVNCTFINNVCAKTGPDVGGGAIRVFDQYEDRPVYVVNSTFGGAAGLGNVGSNGGAISSIGVSWTIINSVFSYNEAIGNGGNPAKTGTVGGGSGGAIYNDGNKMTLTLSGTIIENNTVNAYGSGVFFVTNDHTGDILLENSRIENNKGGSWYPVLEGISMHGDTKLTIVNKPIVKYATPTVSQVFVDGKRVDFEAYLIEGFNYFKLRDLAMALNNSDKQFEITWDGTAKVITLIGGKAYSPVGQELTPGSDGRGQVYQRTVSSVMVDGEKMDFTAYTIKGNNYFRLRDIAEAMDFGVTWDEVSRQIGIDTTTGY